MRWRSEGGRVARCWEKTIWVVLLLADEGTTTGVFLGLQTDWSSGPVEIIKCMVCPRWIILLSNPNASKRDI